MLIKRYIISNLLITLLLKILSKSPNYIKRFGTFHGVRLLFQIEGKWRLPQHSKIINKYHVPDFESPVYLRACVGDHAIFWQCLVRNQYDFSQFPQAKRLQERYDDQTKSKAPPMIIRLYWKPILGIF